MKKIVLMAVVLLSSVATFAQHATGSVSIKPEVGMTIANLTDCDGDAKIGAIAGGELEYQVSPMFGISGGLLYSMQGAKADYTENSVTANAKMKLEYLNVPVLANVYVAPGFALKAGVQFGFLTSSKLNLNGSAAGFTADTDTDIKDNTKSVDISIPLGMSYEYDGFVLDARYNLGATKVFDKGTFNDDAKNSVFQITLGYRFDL
jgi:hypothetical protein